MQATTLFDGGASSPTIPGNGRSDVVDQQNLDGKFNESTFSKFYLVFSSQDNFILLTLLISYFTLTVKGSRFNLLQNTREIMSFKTPQPLLQ